MTIKYQAELSRLLNNSNKKDGEQTCCISEQSDNPLFGGGEGGGIEKGSLPQSVASDWVQKKQASKPAFFVPGADT